MYLNVRLINKIFGAGAKKMLQDVSGNVDA